MRAYVNICGYVHWPELCAFNNNLSPIMNVADVADAADATGCNNNI